jgi:hypothetical protein
MANDRETSPHDRCAIRTASNGVEQRVLAAWLEREKPAAVVEFAPRNDEDLDAELSAGRIPCVVFADLNALLTMVWKSQAHVDRWIVAGVRIEFAQPPQDGNRPQLPSLLAAVCDSHSRWRGAQRVRSIVAGVFLSVLALAAAALLLWIVPPGK